MPRVSLDVTPDDSSTMVFLKNFTRFVVNFLYGFAVRGDIFSSILLAGYIAAAISNKKTEVGDMDSTNLIIAGGTISTVFIVLETIKRYADQIEQNQLTQYEKQLKNLNQALERTADEVDELRTTLPLIVSLRQDVATLNPTQYSRYEFPDIHPLRLTILNHHAALSLDHILSTPTRKKHFVTLYKILVGLVQIFPKNVIASLLFSYLFTLKILKDDPFELFNLISSILVGCMTGIAIVFLNLSQRNGVEATICDQQQNILLLKHAIQIHETRLTTLQTRWDAFIEEYHSIVVQRASALPLTLDDATRTAAHAHNNLRKEVTRLNEQLDLFNQNPENVTPSTQETRININDAEEHNERMPLLNGYSPSL